ncbi:Phospholipase/carboxylesterase [Cystobasidium minutum MCA 4210]|uniref:Phospholipase/carboxylesterase n=1 Tax=Cystobasidium minutum MCA 4210 TaxID=1397322 RepID=UPI0034CF81D8|eukprot:jgi/Rhomi1/153972/estExt_Genewise1.C_5_t10470
MATAALKSIVVPARSAHSATVIFSHGLGDTGHGWSFLAEQLGSSFPHVKWIFPHAPIIPITLNMGMEMPGWFDLKSLKPPRLDDPRAEDEKGILESVAKIQGLVNDESKHVPSERIVVGGFSQGAALSLLVSLTTDKKIAGAVSLSGYLPLNLKVKELRKPESKDTKIFMAHGTVDQVLQYAWGEMSYKFLKEQLDMPNVEFHTYKGMGHSATEEEFHDLAKWLKGIIPAETSSSTDSSKI